MHLSAAITRAPLPYDTRAAAETLAALPAQPDAVRDLLAGAAGCSPYLSGLMLRHAGWLEDVLTRDPADVLEDCLAPLAHGPVKQTGTALRQAKARVALLSALCDLGGVWSLDQVTGALTRLADTAVDVALRSALATPLARGKLPGLGVADADGCGGLFALAMGKMGAHELNYSSDIDLICIFDDALYGDDDLPEARAVLVKAVRQAMALLSEITPEGYVFRTDLRLRPDPSVTPVALSMSAAERYYEGMGRTWERAAFVKARPAAGAVDAGARFLAQIRPFIWRRHLDYATVEDADDIRRKIRAHKETGGRGTLDGRNVKLGPGGIREIEFFTQTRQLIAGGRDRSLRVRGTREGLRRLTERGWVRAQDAAVLDADYVRLREIEHRLQMVQDAQTHALPTQSEAWRRLAMFTGEADPDRLRQELTALFDRVHDLTEDFFAPARPDPVSVDLSEEAERIVARWQGYPALRSDRAQAIFRRLRPHLLQGFDRAADPVAALNSFDGFLKGLPAGVQIFSLFEANPQLIELMVDISATAPALARYLADNSGVLDSVIGGAFFDDWPGADRLEAALAEALAEPGMDYERQLDATRRWQKDWHFRVGVHHLRGLIGPAEAAQQYSDLAQATLAGIWSVCQREFAGKHGAAPGRGAVVLGMGSLGARELSATSDLDLIVVYDAASDVESDGRRPLPARTYFARLTKALVTALSAQTAAGGLYEVDMRLRPSGRQGPAATGWDSFRNYQQTEAWTWEHLALTRARVITGAPTLAADLEAFRQALIAAPRDRDKVLGDLADMRARLASGKPRGGVWDVGNGPGGVQDIALAAQANALLAGCAYRRVHRQLGAGGGLLDEAGRETLAETHRLLGAVRICGRLLTGRDIAPEALGDSARRMLLRDSGAADMGQLEAQIAAATDAAAKVIDMAVGAPNSSHAEAAPDRSPASAATGASRARAERSTGS